MTDAASAMQRILVVGIGDDGPDSVPGPVRARIRTADILAGGNRHLSLFPDAGKERLPVTADLDGLVAQLGAASGSRSVVVLASGDPCFFGIGPLLAERLGRERVEIVPNVSSVALAFARLGVSWQDARVVSAHGRPLSQAIKAATGAEKLAVLTDDTNTPAAVATALLAAGAQDGPAYVFEHLGGPAEAETPTTLNGLKGSTFADLNVLVVPTLTWEKRPEPAGAAVQFGLSELVYAHSGGMITKPEIRAVALSKLRLPPGGVLWDVGAASGSLAIEAVGLAPRVTAYAIERSQIELKHLWRNVATRPNGNRVRVITGDAPDVFADLPDPDSVFVGGSGGRLTDILAEASARLRPHGRIVCNFATVQNLAESLRWGEFRGLQAEVVQVAISRSTDIVGMTRLQGENPVWVVTFRS
ncbi:MAG: precorrin-6y C5,15-methyltransferase (decarboxylating) subunit CbiE [Chloroflexi bacterium]|nr:precorrin-6y C5,15-methyltransferase (decarboxylating) subunit CbiE [Chloroflexota bacterium]